MTLLRVSAKSITDQQIRDLKDWLFERRAYDDVELHGLVACHDALGRSHRRGSARAECARLFNARPAAMAP